MGKAVPSNATAAAPAMRYTVPSADTSPTAATTFKDLFFFLLSILFRDNETFEPRNVDRPPKHPHCLAEFVVERIACRGGIDAISLL